MATALMLLGVNTYKISTIVDALPLLFAMATGENTYKISTIVDR
jgi:hypothetical protein